MLNLWVKDLSLNVLSLSFFCEFRVFWFWYFLFDWVIDRTFEFISVLEDLVSLEVVRSNSFFWVREEFFWLCCRWSVEMVFSFECVEVRVVCFVERYDIGVLGLDDKCWGRLYIGVNFCFNLDVIWFKFCICFLELKYKYVRVC